MIPNGRDVHDYVTVSNSVVRKFQQSRKSSLTKNIVSLARFGPVKRQPLLAKVAARLTKEEYDFVIFD